MLLIIFVDTNGKSSLKLTLCYFLVVRLSTCSQVAITYYNKYSSSSTICWEQLATASRCASTLLSLCYIPMLLFAILSKGYLETRWPYLLLFYDRQIIPGWNMIYQSTSLLIPSGKLLHPGCCPDNRSRKSWVACIPLPFIILTICHVISTD